MVRVGDRLLETVARGTADFTARARRKPWQAVGMLLLARDATVAYYEHPS